MELLEKLSVFNCITFVQDTHSYLINGVRANSLSVTRLLKRYKREFKKNEMAERVAKRTGTTAKQVLADWELNSLYSRTLGTMLHKYIENFYNNKRIAFEGEFEGLGFDEKAKLNTTLPILVQYFQNFYESNSHLHCVKNEMVVGDIEDTKICGTLDMLAYNSNTQCLEILDFKTNKKMSAKSEYANLLHPFDDMSEGEINEYTIQLNMYKYFIEKYTQCKVDKLKLIWLNANNENFKIIELEDIQSKIILMLNHFKSASLFEEQ